MENELRFYMEKVKDAMETGDFDPQYIITATKLPSGAIEVAVNHDKIFDKINYILDTYDDDMCHNKDKRVEMIQLMIV